MTTISVIIRSVAIHMIKIPYTGTSWHTCNFDHAEFLFFTYLENAKQDLTAWA